MNRSDRACGSAELADGIRRNLAYEQAAFDRANHRHGGRPAPKQGGHGLHGLADVPEERLIAGAQVVLAALSERGGGEPVLGAAAVAGGQDVAVAAVPGEGVALVLAELADEGLGVLSG